MFYSLIKEMAKRKKNIIPFRGKKKQKKNKAVLP